MDPLQNLSGTPKLLVSQDAIMADHFSTAKNISTSSTQVVSSPTKTATTNQDTRQSRTDAAPKRGDVEAAVENLNNFFQNKNTVQFTVVNMDSEKDNERMVVQIKDSDGKIIRQIPPEDALKIAQSLDQVIGVLFKQKA